MIFFSPLLGYQMILALDLRLSRVIFHDFIRLYRCLDVVIFPTVVIEFSFGITYDEINHHRFARHIQREFPPLAFFLIVIFGG